MNRSAVLAAFNQQVRQSTTPDGTGASFEAGPHVVRRIAQPGLGGSGVLWSSLDGSDADEVIAEQVAFFRARGEEFEWKLYSYDEPADLADRLRAAGFVAEEPESLMIAAIAEITDALSSAELPAGVRLERATDEAGVDLLIRVHDQVFGEDGSEMRAELLTQLGDAPETTDMVIAMAGDEPVSAARTDFLPGRQFAGLWGGGTLPQWRRRGIYRALVKIRADRAAERGYSYLTVDASDQSRPILERIGFECLAVTTPYNWSAGGSRVAG
ncbi:MAG TPA: GNAT family N-acetyltransferase [Streptosporangiaceae bacterium]|nr:GNAT family N-acetyltransferase [Streptosporangiaceae bacterium]